MSDALYNLTWEQAKALCIAGTEVRRLAWDYWIVYDKFLFWINIDKSGTNARIVLGTDFGDEEFIATDWTTADIAAQDPCAGVVLPPLPTQFNFSAKASCQNGLIADVSIPDVSLGDAWRVDIYNGLDLLGSVNLNARMPFAELSLSWPLHSPDNYPITNFFPGFTQANTWFRKWEYRDWDSCLIPFGSSPVIEGGFISGGSYPYVDGHVIYRANGNGTATIIESTGNYTARSGYTVGTTVAIADAQPMDGAIVSNTRRNSSIVNSGCTNSAGDKLYGVLSEPVHPSYTLTAIFTNTAGYPGLTRQVVTKVDWPLPIFTYTTGTPASHGAGTSYPISIPFSVARDWYQKKEWNATAHYIQNEIKSGDFSTGDDTASARWTAWTNCSRATGFSFTIHRIITIASSGVETLDETISVTVDLLSGYRDGDDFYPKIEIIYPGNFSSKTTPGTGYGTPTAKIGGYSIPMGSVWTPGWAGDPGYVNAATFNLNIT